MARKVDIGFEPEGKTIPIEKILASRKLPATIESSLKYKKIVSSMDQLGIIEPLIVYPQSRNGQYLLLDGHLRLHVLKQRGDTEVFCLISTEDESLTYNHKVSQVQAIQEHFMILKAIRNGVSEDRIAATLNIDVAKIKEKRDLLKGICPEAVELLRDRNIFAKALAEVKKVKPMRQIEMAELMIASNNYTSTYARAMVMASKPEDRLSVEKAPDPDGLSAADLARMEHEMEQVGRDFRMMEETHGKNVLNLVLATGYLKKLLNNAAIVRYLSQHHDDLLGELQSVVDATSLAEKA